MVGTTIFKTLLWLMWGASGHYVPSKANFRHFFRALFDSLDRDDDSWRDVQVPTIASGTSTPIHDGKL